MAAPSSSARGPTRVFILVADHDITEGSLTRRVLKASIDVLVPPNYLVTVTDCAKDGWLDPISAKDFTRLSDPIRINVRNEHQVSPLIQKIQDEQTKLFQCDLFLIFAPLSWFGPPSLFFNWWQRVVTAGRCYGPNLQYQRGAFARKRALLVMVSSQRSELFGRDTLAGTVEEIVYPITHGMLYPTGFRIHRTQTLYMNNPATQEEILAKWQSAVRDLEERTCLAFNPPTNYTNWVLSTPEKERKNDLELLQKTGDMSLLEATMKINTSLND
jgi:NAD(P)H dehydrogenase (quinone)